MTPVDVAKSSVTAGRHLAEQRPPHGVDRAGGRDDVPAAALGQLERAVQRPVAALAARHRGLGATLVRVGRVALVAGDAADLRVGERLDQPADGVGANMLLASEKTRISPRRLRDGRVQRRGLAHTRRGPAGGGAGRRARPTMRFVASSEPSEATITSSRSAG